MTLVLKDFKHLKKYSKLVERRLLMDLWELIYKHMFKMLDIKARNDENVLIDALNRGEIFYVDGGFKAKKQFSNAVASELIRLGAKYDSYTHSFVISKDLLSPQVNEVIQNNLLRAQTKLNLINDFLADIQLNLDQIIETMIFDNEIETIVNDVGEQVERNVRKIHIISPELTDQQKREIAADYTYNMQYYIKKWASDRIPLMRKKVQQAILDGYREDQVQEMLEKEYNVGKKKAKFLAHNETSIMLAALKKSMYTEMGFTEFIWQTILDGRERLLHKQLHGKIFAFDSPPIIDERTGQTGLPGQTYNCRCNLIPIKRDSVFFDKSDFEAKDYKDIMKYGPNE